MEAFGRNSMSPKALAAYMPPTTIVLCYTNRCGSNYLAAALASTGKVPAAGELFNDRALISLRGKRNWPTIDHAYLQLAKRHTQNGVFATKLTWAQLFFVSKRRIIPRIFGWPKFVLMSRRDLLDQAISLIIANQTGAWTSNDSKQAEPVYDRTRIINTICGFSRANGNFHRYFSTFGIRPYEVAYEDFANDVATTISGILNWCGFGSGQIDVSKIHINQQRDSLNTEWRERFLDEVHDYFNYSPSV